MSELIQIEKSYIIEWYPAIIGPHIWSDAIEIIRSLGDKWRLPTVKELIGLWDYDNGTIIDKKHENMLNKNFWSSSSFANNPTYAWYVSFSSGGVSSGNKTVARYVRCVCCLTKIDSLNIKSFDSSKESKLKGILED